MTDGKPADPPSPFVAQWAHASMTRTERRARALDVAMGRGRHAVMLAEAGYVVFGVDIRFDAVREAVMRAAGRGRRVHGWCADLTATALPSGAFDLIVVTRYLQRNLFPSLMDALAPGGVLLYETFTVRQREKGWGPTSADHLLESGELRDRLAPLDILFYEEAIEPEAVARLAAQRARSRS
jgi:SAM-dependent methyltransferase